MSSLTQDRSHFLGPHDFRTVESDPFSPLHTILVCYQVSPPRRPRCSRVHPSHHLCFPPPSFPFFSFPFLIALFYSAVTIRKSIPVNPRQPRQLRETGGGWEVGLRETGTGMAPSSPCPPLPSLILYYHPRPKSNSSFRRWENTASALSATPASRKSTAGQGSPRAAKMCFFAKGSGRMR